eukprot:CAMPEP_0182456710 /NCGR_PEP_ID=MMETSP1319-20130603/2484_1 /TAXON_ID=172717 /ORGANISM="Bolidomonas pacifica, Strain RCC208" /LENGTH=80 /DNA_ID=CAMNT_0024655023 /DNA_START=133 /DNA_END=371 /DNA_ORIENTATION=-
MGFSFSCALLFTFSAPSDVKMDRPLEAYGFVYFLVICFGFGFADYKRGKDTGIIAAGIALVVFWVIFYFLLQARKRIARS